MRGAFITGTGTGVGKTIVAAALCAALKSRGEPVVASKPLLSGMDESAPAPWPHDHELLAIATGADADEISPVRFGPAVSPHLAARLAGDELTVEGVTGTVIARHADAAGDRDPFMIVEGAGGLLVPLDDDGTSMADLAAAVGLPLIIAAHPGLGTINHVLLTLEAARTRRLAIAGVVLTPWPETPTLIETDNRAFLTLHAGVPVVGLTAVTAPDAGALAAAGEAAGLPELL